MLDTHNSRDKSQSNHAEGKQHNQKRTHSVRFHLCAVLENNGRQGIAGCLEIGKGVDWDRRESFTRLTGKLWEWVFGGNGYVYYLDCCDIFTGKYIFQNLANFVCKYVPVNCITDIFSVNYFLIKLFLKAKNKPKLKMMSREWISGYCR